jgi:sulfide:quinone oxidoreductase
MKKKAVVVGGGFAGVQAAISLQKSNLFEVTLISDREYLFLYPTSIWIPVRLIAPEKARVSLERISRAHGFSLIVDRVSDLKPDTNRVVCGAREVSYDYLVLALGAGKLPAPGDEHTLTICGTPESTGTIRDRIDSLLAAGGGSIAVGFAGNPKDTSALRGGPAFELVFNIDTMLRRKKVRDRFTLSFFAPMPRPGERMGEKALKLIDTLFTRLGIRSYRGKKITTFTGEGVVFEDDSVLASDLTIFIAGGAGNQVVVKSGLPVNEAGFVRIDDTGLVQGTTNVYAAGDVAAIEGPAWRAKQGHIAEIMAANAAFNIRMTELGRPKRKGYARHLSILCIMDTGNGAALVYRDAKRNTVIPMPVVGHWLKQLWGAYARISKVWSLS